MSIDDDDEETQAWIYSRIALEDRILAVISAIMTLALCFVWVLVFKKVKFKDWSILLMILSLILQMAANILWYIFDGIFAAKHEKYDLMSDTFCDVYEVLVIAPLTFYLIAVVFNLYNWIYFYYKIGEMARYLDSNGSTIGEQRNFK